MAYGRRAAGRAEMLRSNQQRKKKRKAPSNPAPKKEASQETKTKVAYSSDSFLKTKPVRPPVKNPPPVPQDKPKEKPPQEKPPQAPTDSQIRQLVPDGGKREIPPSGGGQTKDKEKYKPTTGTVNPNAESEQRRDYAKYNPGTGTYGSHRPSDGPPKRSSYPRGKAGDIKYRRALAAYKSRTSGSNNVVNRNRLRSSRRGTGN